MIGRFLVGYALGFRLAVTVAALPKHARVRSGFFFLRIGEVTLSGKDTRSEWLPGSWRARVGACFADVGPWRLRLYLGE